MSQKITVQQFKEAIQVVSKAFQTLGDQKEINILPLIGGMGGAGNIHLALMRMNLLAQQLEANQLVNEPVKEETNEVKKDEQKEEEVDVRYKAGTVIL
jgi:hypothetical protein